jgi:hypothetical protein
MKYLMTDQLGYMQGYANSLTLRMELLGIDYENIKKQEK